MSEEEMPQGWQKINALQEELKSSGAWVFSARLHPPDTATVVRSSRQSPSSSREWEGPD